MQNVLLNYTKVKPGSLNMPLLSAIRLLQQLKAPSNAKKIQLKFANGLTAPAYKKPYQNFQLVNSLTLQPHFFDLLLHPRMNSIYTIPQRFAASTGNNSFYFCNNR